MTVVQNSAFLVLSMTTCMSDTGSVAHIMVLLLVLFLKPYLHAVVLLFKALTCPFLHGLHCIYIWWRFPRLQFNTEDYAEKYLVRVTEHWIFSRTQMRLSQCNIPKVPLVSHRALETLWRMCIFITTVTGPTILLEVKPSDTIYKFLLLLLNYKQLLIH